LTKKLSPFIKLEISGHSKANQSVNQSMGFVKVKNKIVLLKTVIYF